MRARGRRLVGALGIGALALACSSGGSSGEPASTTVPAAVTTTTAATTSLPPSTTTTTTSVPVPVPSTSTTLPAVPGTPGPSPAEPRFPRLEGAATVVPAFVVSVDDARTMLWSRPTLGDAASRAMFRAPVARVLDGVSVRPDGSEVLVGVRGGDGCASTVVAVDVARGTTRDVVVNATSPLLSGDGTRLAYARVDATACTRTQLVVRDLRTGTERTLGEPQERAVGSVAWSPDSARLAFTDCVTRCRLDVWVAADDSVIDFGDTARTSYSLSPGLPTLVELAVSAPIGWFASGDPYATGRCACDENGAPAIASFERDRPVLYAMRTPITERTVAFAGDNELVVRTPSGGLARRHGGGALVDLEVQSADGAAAWPSAKGWDAPLPAATGGRPPTIVTTVRGSVVELESASGAVVRVIHAATDARAGAIALDRQAGRVYAGMNTYRTCETDLVSVPLDGGTAAVIGAGASPALSPDRTQLAYVANLWARTSTEPPARSIGCALSVIVVRDLRTGAERQVSPPGFVPGDASTGSWELGATQLRWSPDGRRLAYVLGYEGSSAYVLDVATMTTRMVDLAPGVDAELRDRLGCPPELFVLDWTADGLELSASGYGCGVPAVHVLARDGATVDAIFTTPFPPLDARNGHLLVVDEATDRSPGLGRVGSDGTKVLLRTDTTTGVWR